MKRQESQICEGYLFDCVGLKKKKNRTHENEHAFGENF